MAKQRELINARGKGGGLHGNMWGSVLRQSLGDMQGLADRL